MRDATPNDRLRMLWHLGCVRSALGDRSFGILVEKGYVFPLFPEERLDKIDYRLTDKGREEAEYRARHGWRF